MRLLYIEIIDKANDEENELIRVITGDVYSTNDELRAMVTLDLADIKEEALYDSGVDLVVHSVSLGKLISLSVTDIDGSESTDHTHTCTIFADVPYFDKGFTELWKRYDAQFAPMVTSD